MSESAVPVWFVPALQAIYDHRELSPDQMTAIMESLLAGTCGPVETAALLTSLHTRGETAAELACAASVLRRHSRSLEIAGRELLDTCGTGGDASGTFNISTATAIVAAGAGARVVKHGNRAVSSMSGSADVLRELGVGVAGDPETARRSLERAGMAFCLAPLYHPALKHVGEVRRRLGVRTMFNCLGPLANPAGASCQLLGIGRMEWLDRMAGALARLGTGRAFLVHSRDGLDEISLGGPTVVREVRGHEIREHEWTASDFDLAPCSLAELRVEGPQASAQMILAILEGQEGAPRRVVLANTAAALLAAGLVPDLRQGVARAQEALDQGRARATLEALVESTRSPL